MSENVDVIVGDRADTYAARNTPNVWMGRVYAAVDDCNADSTAGAARKGVHTLPSLRFTT